MMAGAVLVRCDDHTCVDVDRGRRVVPPLQIDPERVRVLMVHETAAPDAADDVYADGVEPLFARTTVEAFRAAGLDVASVADLTALGVHLTPAVKCAKLGPRVSARTIATCSHLLERELEAFPHLRAILLMGDVAIAGLNAVARRLGEPRPVPAGSTYRLRGGSFAFRGIPVLPSYLQAGPAFGIETSKRRMIAEDIAAAMSLAHS